MSSALKSELAYQAAFTQSRNKMAQMAPEEITRRSLCRFDTHRGYFEIPSLGQMFQVSYPAGQIRWNRADKDVPLDWALVLLNYLSSATVREKAGHWVGYRELPSGQIFYANLEHYVLKDLSAFYARCDKRMLCAVMEKSGFVAVASHTDTSLQINFVPRVPMLLQFWDGDEEFPAACQILFDRTASAQLHIEDLAVACGIVKRFVQLEYRAFSETQADRPPPEKKRHGDTFSDRVWS